MAVLLKKFIKNQCASHLSTYRIPLRSKPVLLQTMELQGRLVTGTTTTRIKWLLLRKSARFFLLQIHLMHFPQNVVVVVVPRTAPTVVATASAISAPLIFGRCPSSSNIPALVDTPINVPIVSNISTNKNAKITTMKFRENTPHKSSYQIPA